MWQTLHTQSKSERLFCEQSLWRVGEVNLPALISNLACPGHKEAIQSLLEGRNPFVFTSSSTVVPAHVPADLLESAPCLDELRVCHRIANFSLETWSECCGLCQLYVLNETLEQAKSVVDDRVSRSFDQP